MKKTSSPRQFAVIFTIVGALAIFTGLRGIQESNASKSWPSTQGTIISSGVRAPRTNSSKNLYSAAVRYEFTVDGRKHTSDRVSFGDASSSSSSDAQKVAARYPVGAAVTVHYSPEDPTSSVLEAGSTGANYFLPLIGLGFFGTGLWCFRAAPKKPDLEAKS